MPDVYESCFPTLHINRDYLLREQSIDDAEDFLAYYSHAEVNQYIYAEVPTSIPAALNEIIYCRNLFAQKKGLYWTIARADNNQMIGAFGLYQRSADELEICYDLDRNYWSKGIISAAIDTVITFAFSKMNCKEIFAITTHNNHASIRVLEKNKFKHVGTLKQYRYFKGTMHDVEKFILTP